MFLEHWCLLYLSTFCSNWCRIKNIYGLNYLMVKICLVLKVTHTTTFLNIFSALLFAERLPGFSLVNQIFRNLTNSVTLNHILKMSRLLFFWCRILITSSIASEPALFRILSRVTARETTNNRSEQLSWVTVSASLSLPILSPTPNHLHYADLLQLFFIQAQFLYWFSVGCFLCVLRHILFNSHCSALN